MSDLELLLVSAAVAGLILAAVVAAVETVVTRMNLVRALRLAEQEARGSRWLLWLLERRATVLDALLVVTVVGRIFFAAVAVMIGMAVEDGTWPIVVALILAALISLVFTEVLPRTLALRHLEGAGRVLSGPAVVLVRLADPLARVIVASGRALVPKRHGVSGPHASDDEIRQFDGDDEEQDDLIEPEERAMIRSIFELADTIVREVMVPRPDMVTVSEGSTLSEIISVVVSEGFSRLPVHAQDDPESIVGVVYAKDLLARVSTGHRGGRWGDLVRPPTFVPETKRADELLRELQATAVHLAIVVDEYGEIVGLATIEDILEEIVGEIIDEHDHEEVLVEPMDDGRMRIDARIGVDDLNEVLGTSLPEEGWDTVGGLVFGTLGRVAVEGEEVELDSVVITVERVQGRRVVKVIVEVRTSGDDQRDGDEGGDPQATVETSPGAQAAW